MARRRNKTKLDRYANMSVQGLTRKSTKELKEMYSYMRKVYLQRAKRFEQGGYSFRFATDINPLRTLKNERSQIARGVKELQELILNKRTTIAGYKEIEYAKKETFENRFLKQKARDEKGNILTDEHGNVIWEPRKFKDDEEYWAFRRFLDAMSTKYGLEWERISGDVIETIEKEFMPNIDINSENGINPARIWDNFTLFMQEEKKGKAKWETIKRGYELQIKQGRKIVDRFSRDELRSLGLPTLKEWKEMFNLE